ncbi:MAG TPA: hypothetical protein DEP88_06900 [Verrucomicrobiales bacterium]|nr:hypothetical protein [Verrucomicrobiales bacterium]HCI92359.1 hypothetical protein [Verrucomicrobiales bacterium]HCL97113.1 hypothetical protein [Verrucomicrobiales bacterium]
MCNSQSDSNTGRWFLCLIAISILAMGFVFGWLLLRSYQNASATRDWSEEQTVILRSAVEQRQILGSPIEYRFKILYGYDFQNESYTSDKLSIRGSKWSKQQETIVDLAEKYPANSSHVTWVNPDNPTEAILEHDTKAAGYTLWFPALFIVAGGGMIWGAFRGSA